MDILELLKKPEGKTLEFKRDLSSPEGILRVLVAFANTGGGTLIVGVEDGDHKVRGVEEPLAMEERLASIITDSIQPKIVPNIEIIPWHKTYLIAIEVYPSPYRPHYLRSLGLEKGAYVRVGSTNRLADSNLILKLQRLSRGESFDMQPILESSSEAIDFKVASELFAKYRELKKADLETLHLIIHYQACLVPTVGGMLLFGKERAKYFPDAWVQVGRFSGKNKTKIIDTRELHDSPIIAIYEAIEFVKKHSLQAIEINEVARNEKWNIPQAAVREAIINAVVHADYSQRGSPIRIAIYDDRLEIENPGLIPFNLTLEDLYQGVSKLRNPVIGRVFHELKLIERWGSGIRRMIESCKNAGLQEPLLEEIGTHFRVTIFLEKKYGIKLDDINHKIIHLLEKKDGLSTREISEQIRLSPRSTRSRLLSLIERGLIMEIGSSPQDPRKKYFLAKS
ncbi:MAG: putative DNA binding domain-containing protein [Proteobacteria bacterium]|nr:putative DNA binding domain-containing protein [Pseudomonadota bacterium]